MVPIFLKIFFYSCLGPTWHSNQRFNGHTVRRLGLCRNNYNFRTEWSLKDGPSPIVKSGVLAVYHLHNAFNFVFVCLFTFFKERHHRLGIKISLLQWPKAYCCDHHLVITSDAYMAVVVFIKGRIVNSLTDLTTRDYTAKQTIFCCI